MQGPQKLWVRMRSTLRLTHLLLLAPYAFLLAALLPFGGRKWRYTLVRHWSSRALRAMRVRVHVHPQEPGARQLPSAGMLLPNHMSWLDIVVMNAILPSRFVTKDDVRKWPVIGWIACCIGTLFVRRGARMEAGRMHPLLIDVLAKGERLVIFAEGTTTDGRTVLPFRGALLEAAVQAGSHVHPVALRYHTPEGELDMVPVYIDDDSFGESIWRILAQPELHVSLTFGTPLPARERHRRELAELAREEVLRMLQLLDEKNRNHRV